MIPPKKSTGKWALIAFCAVILFQTPACKQPEIPTYQALENFRLEKVGMRESVVSADLKYYNPNRYDLQFKRANLSLWVNNKAVGNTVLDTLIRIPKLDTFYIPVQMKVDLRQLLGNALTLLTNNEMDIKVNGTIRMGRSGVFMNLPVDYQGKQKIEW